MTRKEAFLTAVRGDIPDRVPVSPLIHCRYAYTVLGRTDWRAIFELHQRLGTTAFRGPCGVQVNTDLPSPYGLESADVTEPDGRNIHSTTLRTPDGQLHSETVSGMIPHDPIVSKKTEYEVKNRDDWEIYLSYLQATLEADYTLDTSAAKEQWTVMGEDGVASVAMTDSFTNAGNVRGMEQILMDLYDYPDLMREVFELFGRQRKRKLEAFLQAPNEVLYYDICWATGCGMSPQMFEEWILPDLVETCETVHSQPDKYVGFYTLGRIRNLLPIIVESDPDYIETFEQNEGDITMAEAKRLYPGEFCIMGNFDPMVLAFGSAEDAREETLRCLREGMPGGGYVMVTGDEVPADTKWDNLVTMAETVMEHGVYDD